MSDGFGGGGKVFVVCVVEEMERDVAERRENTGGVAATNAAAVFAEGHVAGVVQAVFDGPVIAGPLKQFLGVGFDAGQAGDAVNRLGCRLALCRPCPHQPKHLADFGPGVEVVVEPDHRREGAGFDPPVSLTPRVRRVEVRVETLLELGGENPRSFPR